MVDPFLPDPEKLAAVRDALPATAAGIYLDTATSGPLPAEVAAAMRQIQDRELTVGRADEASIEDFADRIAEVKGVVAALLGADPDDVVLAHSVTECLAAALAGPAALPGALVTTDQEPESTTAYLEGQASHAGASLVRLSAGPDIDESKILAQLDASLAQGARLVVISHVLPTTGRVMPVADIGARCGRLGVPLVVDGSQACGAMPIAAPELGVAVYLTAGHTWLLGPAGVTAAWLDRGRWPNGLASLPAAGPGDFERATLAGLARAVGWLEMYVGLPWIHERGAVLAVETSARLAAVPGVSVLTPRERMASIVTFRLDGWSAPALREELGRRVFAIVGIVPALDALRLSVAWFNTETELEQLLDALGSLAEEGPDAPRRPALVFLGDAAHGGSPPVS
jgi:L-cysteine/cystine lyase